MDDLSDGIYIDDNGDRIHPVHGNLKYGENYASYLFEKSIDQGDLLFYSDFYDKSGFWGYVRGEYPGDDDVVVFRIVEYVGDSQKLDKGFTTLNRHNLYKTTHEASWEHINGKCDCF